MDLDPKALADLRAALLEGIVTGRGHRPDAAERSRAYALYQALREARFGPVPRAERLGGGVRNSLDGESPLVRRLLGP